LQGVANEVISNIGAYALNQIDIIPQKLSLLVSGRYDRVVYDFHDELASFKDTARIFAEFTPKAALNYKLTPHIALYTSYGFGFDSPAGNELDNYIYTSDSGLHTINPDLKAQKSSSFEVGKRRNCGAEEKIFQEHNF
jgi:iron complex outermembrane receptor protein